MSKKDGTLFSSALFGYKKSDVNEYIKLADISYSDQISLLHSENERLLERAKNAESRVEELEKIISEMENEHKLKIENLFRDFESELKQATDAAKGVSETSSHSRSQKSEGKKRGIMNILNRFKKK